jgi:hypothetical protein
VRQQSCASHPQKRPWGPFKQGTHDIAEALWAHHKHQRPELCSSRVRMATRQTIPPYCRLLLSRRGLQSGAVANQLALNSTSQIMHAVRTQACMALHGSAGGTGPCSSRYTPQHFVCTDDRRADDVWGSPSRPIQDAEHSREQQCVPKKRNSKASVALLQQRQGGVLPEPGCIREYLDAKLHFRLYQLERSLDGCASGGGRD